MSTSGNEGKTRTGSCLDQDGYGKIELKRGPEGNPGTAGRAAASGSPAVVQARVSGGVVCARPVSKKSSYVFKIAVL